LSLKQLQVYPFQSQKFKQDAKKKNRISVIFKNKYTVLIKLHTPVILVHFAGFVQILHSDVTVVSLSLKKLIAQSHSNLNKVIDYGYIQQIQQLSERLVIIACDWSKLLDPR